MEPMNPGQLTILGLGRHNSDETTAEVRAAAPDSRWVWWEPHELSALDNEESARCGYSINPNMLPEDYYLIDMTTGQARGTSASIPFGSVHPKPCADSVNPREETSSHRRQWPLGQPIGQDG
jgi:hypothetical protein